MRSRDIKAIFGLLAIFVLIFLFYNQVINRLKPTSSNLKKDFASSLAKIEINDDLTFKSYKKELSRTFTGSTEVIIKLSTEKSTSSDSIVRDISIIQNISTRIKETRTPQEIEVNSKEAFKSIVSALRNINNSSEIQVSDMDKKLNNIESMADKIDSQNYKEQINNTILAVNSVIQELNKA